QLQGHACPPVSTRFYSLGSDDLYGVLMRLCLCRDPSLLVCCSGWGPEGNGCTVPLCEGDGACQEGEICVFPGMCRCRHGFYGARCKTACPSEFWGPDCRELCHCYPHGHCDPVTGKCTCSPSRWGPVCQNVCKCSRHGRCDPLNGDCICNEGWWTPNCGKNCQCSQGGTLACHPVTGRCQCAQGYWGLNCSLRCSCNTSSCNQRTGDCECVRGSWGPSCERHCKCDLGHGECSPLNGHCECQPGYKSPFCSEACGGGYYGAGCKLNCSVVDGTCDSCDPGWNGMRCDQPCPPGYHGSGCQEVCPSCRSHQPCDPETGECSQCDPGWTGPRCDAHCPEGTFGESCHLLCNPCFHGHCDHVTGGCVCLPGFQGENCNSTCPGHQYGVNCSFTCDCGEGGCHPSTGACLYGAHAGLIAGILSLLGLVLLVLVCCCCCCCCGGEQREGKERVAVGDGGPAARMKHHVYSVLANVSSAVPCFSLWTTGLPRVTVSHHDPELTFNHSFIEPPSGWMMDNSFESDEDESLYCVPPREDIATVASGEFQELSSKCNMFPDPSVFNSEDVSLAFGIPRTSSIAKAKRPSVSFAEGTRFTPNERRGSGQDTTGASRKSKSPWGVLMLSALQGQGGKEGEEEVQSADQAEETDRPMEEQGDVAKPEDAVRIPGHNRRRTMSSSRRSVQPQVSSGSQSAEICVDKVTTVYVTLGKAASRPRQEPSTEGLVQTMLRRLGSLQRQKDEGRRPRGRGEWGSKAPRRRLGERASAWEQAAGGAGAEVPMRKPSRRKHGSTCAPGPSSAQSEGATPKRPLSSILKSVHESASPGTDAKAALMRESRDCDDPSEGGYQTVGPAEENMNLGDIVAVDVAYGDNGPNYENVVIKHV
uniref:EGF-like domain-containing protein n=1 Tax=Denticeps clupeoides TaxID=299321 RepID=A0AAY4D6D3_9TELE